MAIQRITTGEPITVATTSMLIYGQPGAGKTSLAFTAKNPILLDFDGGAHRSKNRKDIVRFDTWTDAVDFVNDEANLAPYDTIIIDTVGRALDFITDDLIKSNYKLGTKNGSLSMQGWGELKGVFTAFMKRLAVAGKDVVLVAHVKEDKSGDFIVNKPDVQGGSKTEVMKLVDSCGFLFSSNNKRTLSFAMSDTHDSKDVAQIGVVAVDSFEGESDYLARLVNECKRRMSEQSNESLKVAEVVQEWADAINTFENADDFNNVLPELMALKGAVKKQVNGLVKKRRESLGIEFDSNTRRFVGSEVAA